MNKIQKAFLSSAVVFAIFVVVGAVSIFIMREFSFITVFPILGGVYFGVITYFKYKEAKSKQITEYTVRLVSIEKKEGIFSEEYHFETEGAELADIFVSGAPVLTADDGKKLKKGYLYNLVYLTDDGVVPDYDDPFSVTAIKGISKKTGRDGDVVPHSEK